MPQFANRAECAKHTTAKFRDLIVEITGAHCEEDDAEFARQKLDEMGMDSLDKVELMIALEEEIGGEISGEISDEDAEQYANVTVGEAVEAIVNNRMARQ